MTVTRREVVVIGVERGMTAGDPSFVGFEKATLTPLLKVKVPAMSQSSLRGCKKVSVHRNCRPKEVAHRFGRS